MARELSAQQRLFIAEYLEDFNGTQAAIRAGYSEQAARQQASLLLTNPAIRDAIESERVARLAKRRKEREEFHAILLRRVRSNMGDFASWGESGVRIRSSSQLKRWHTQNVKSISEGKEGVKIALKDENKAMEILAKLYGLTKEETARLVEHADDFSDALDSGKQAGKSDEEVIANYLKVVGSK